jgi:hypothetical protein
VEVPADTPAAPAMQKVLVTLSQVTAYLGGHLLRLSVGAEPKGLLPVHCKATGCLFLPAGGRRTALVQLDGGEPGDKAFQDKLVWKGGRNAYGAFQALLQQQPAGGEMAPPGMKSGGWQTLSGENDSDFEVKLKAAPASDTRFTQVLPGQLVPADEQKGLGASLKIPLRINH